MKLIEPTMEYDRQIRAYRQEFMESGDSMDGTGGLSKFEDPQEWIDFLAKHRDPKTIPEELIVTAMTDDGEVMAVQHRDYPIYGLQFHPESIMTPDGKKILENFIHTK